MANLIACFQEHGRTPIKRVQLQEFLRKMDRGSHSSSLSLRQRDLERLGVIRATLETHNDQNIRLLTITNLDKIIAHYNGPSLPQRARVKRANNIQIELDIKDAGEAGQLLPVGYDLLGKVEGLFTGILDAACRLSANDKRTFIECNYHFRERDKIKITTKTLSNSEIIQLSDQRVIRALNASFTEFVESKYGPIGRLEKEEIDKIDGLFFFDLFDLCHRIDLQPSPRNRELVRKMIERLRDTAFEIDASESAYFREVYGRGADSIQYRYITEFYAKKQNELFDEAGDVYRFSERLYFIKFHSVLLQQLLTKGRAFIAHPELTKERCGIAHRLYNWCKASIGVRPKAGDPIHAYLMDDFWEKVMPSARLDNFCRDLGSLLERNRIEANSENANSASKFTSLVYGYLIEVSMDQDDIEEVMRRKSKRFRAGGKYYPVLRISRDVNDLYIGDNSNHNQALRRISNELERATEDE